jgi:hypothetical protein
MMIGASHLASLACLCLCLEPVSLLLLVLRPGQTYKAQQQQPAAAATAASKQQWSALFAMLPVKALNSIRQGNSPHLLPDLLGTSAGFVACQ